MGFDSFFKGFVVFVLLSVLGIAKTNTMFNIYTLKGKEDGPTLLVIGGIHGDEPGGYFAPAFMAEHYKITKGNVIIVPNLNPDSIVAFRRGIYNDMNRKFAKIKANDPDLQNVKRIKELITNPKVSFVVNLHDGHGFYRTKWENSIFNPRAWGQTYVIDQKTLDNVPFGDLDEITKKIEAKLNQTLHYDFHTFGVRNTETKFKDEEQQNSLTFFAITHLKPAIAIETSKNIKELPLKVLYQLSSIEALMEIMGIAFQRDFTLDLENVEKRIDDYGSVKINDNITLPLNNLRKSLRFMPLLANANDFVFTHPLGSVRKNKKNYEVYVGHKKISTLSPDVFSMQCTLKPMRVKVDGKSIEAKFGETLEFKKNFLVESQKNARVNVIGYSKKGVRNENDLLIDEKEIDKSYSLDTKGEIFRVEIYQGKNFCGTINLKSK